MRRRLLLAACLGVALRTGSAVWAQESIQALPGAHKQQDIELIHHPPVQQQVTAVDAAGQQEVSKNQVPTPTQRRLNTVSKVAVGVLATTVALAASAASLLLL